MELIGFIEGAPPIVRRTRQPKGEHITYNTAHVRVHRARGKASTYTCVDCQGPASTWSYNHNSTDELHGPAKGKRYTAAYSPNVADYEPRCRPCHHAFDRAHRAAA